MIVGEVFNDVFSNHEELVQFMKTTEWKYGWKSNVQRDNYSFFHKHYAGSLSPEQLVVDEPANLDDLPSIIRQCWDELKEKYFQGHTLTRCYANAMPYGCDGTGHRDTLDPRSYTAVYYPVEDWHGNWGGETVFMTSDYKDIIQSVLPRPNRIVIFPGNIPHLARGTERTCPVMRVTLMFKTIKLDA
jgi:SM-20-related protein